MMSGQRRIMTERGQCPHYLVLRAPVSCNAGVNGLLQPFAPRDGARIRDGGGIRGLLQAEVKGRP